MAVSITIIGKAGFFNICAKAGSLTSPTRGLPKVAVTTDTSLVVRVAQI
jgi:hypothetical protein